MAVNVKVTVGDNEPIEKAIKRFKRMCEKAGIKKECKARRYHEKPSESRRRELRKRARNRKKSEREALNKPSRSRGRENFFTHPKLSEN